VRRRGGEAQQGRDQGVRAEQQVGEEGHVEGEEEEVLPAPLGRGEEVGCEARYGLREGEEGGGRVPVWFVVAVVAVVGRRRRGVAGVVEEERR
jgi:hypothetical protein